MQPVRNQTSAVAIFKPRDELVGDPETGRHRAAGRPGVNTLLQNVDAQLASQVPAQRRGQPHLLVVASTGIQAHHQRRRANPFGQMVDVIRQIRTARFLAGFDHDHTTGVRHTLRLQRHQGSQRGEAGIAIIGATTAVKLVIAQYRLPRPQPLRPAFHLRLLVQMAIHQHRIAAVGITLNFDQQQRRAPLKTHHLDLGTAQLAGLDTAPAPARELLDHLLHVSVLAPARVKHRRLVGDADVLNQLGHDLLVPALVNEATSRGQIESAHISSSSAEPCRTGPRPWRQIPAENQ